ncbi:hypothetical protein A2866_02570 [Candidatus Roizmanbacteria bacterium RIFCSPHIGHO2_01_FULL_39_8]|uniref:Uncharacterized protein n=2 Tax=Candidatus Roizmaniibacteriota TaxID=1752723 RepID=A0A1F7GPW7_9BACT|nr:MAG: hypothetical protein A2866_02570 [Candidatus Roizmanbacteria bacterium RIFCSPHIGHO2_01_FULL_39_8]OGK27709.1 MAG: hypothetical protein A3C28_02355 [Candidatus Roizmanbacteria bacterium RIFCSPHIGHO2_02_FULL_39_9]
MQDLIQTPENPTFLSGNPLEKLWSIPEFSAVPQGWQMPPGLQIGIASRNTTKIDVANRAVQELGGRPILANTANEDAIKQHLESQWQQRGIYSIVSADFYRISSIAHYKALAAFWGSPDVTHVIGFDTDVYKLGVKNEGPFHTLPDYESYIRTLKKVSGQHVQVRIAGSLADVQRRAVIAFDEVVMRFRLAQFDPLEFVEIMGTDAIGKIAGGIDYSDERVIPFLDKDFPIIVDRSESPRNLDEQFERKVFLNPVVGPKLLRYYFKGCPPELIKWIIYNGISNPVTYLTMYE